MPFVADRIQESTSTTGTGAFTLSGTAALRYLTFNGNVPTGSRVEYCCESASGGEWEVGEGIFTAPSTLTREVILSSSNSGLAVNFPSGEKSIFLTVSGGALAGCPIDGFITAPVLSKNIPEGFVRSGATVTRSNYPRSELPGAVVTDSSYTIAAFYVNSATASNANAKGCANPSGTVVVPCSYGVRVSKDNGLTWAAPNVPIQNLVQAICWNGTSFYLTDTLGYIWSSTNGTSWSFVTQVAGSLTVYSIAWNGTVFVLGILGRDVYTSANGSSWTKQTNALSVNMASCYRLELHGTTFIAVSATGSVMNTSSNGVTWTEYAMPSSAQWNIASSGSRLLAVSGTTTSYYSDNVGVSWTAGGTVTNTTTSVCYYANAGVFAASGSVTGSISTSPDCVTWTSRSHGTSPYFGAATDILIATPTNLLRVPQAGSSGAKRCGSDLATWTGLYYPALASPTLWASDKFGTVLYFSSSNGGLVIKTNGPTTSILDFQVLLGINCGIASIAYNGSVWCALPQAPSTVDITTVYTSPDLVTWTPRTVPAGKYTSLASNGVNFVLVAASTGTVGAYSNTTGATWTSLTFALNISNHFILGGYGLYVRTDGASSQIQTSTDGVTWTTRTPTVTPTTNRIAICPDGYLVVGNSSSTTASISKDYGVTWESVTNAYPATYINSITPTGVGSKCFVVGTSGVSQYFASGGAVLGQSSSGSASYNSTASAGTGTIIRFGTNGHYIATENSTDFVVPSPLTASLGFTTYARLK